MNNKKIVAGSAFYSIGNMVGSGLNMLYQFILMLFLTSEDYGVIQPLLQFIGLLLLPITAYQFSLTTHFSNMMTKDVTQEVSLLLRKLLIITAGIVIVWVILIPSFQSLFHVNDTLIFILLLISVCMYFLLSPYVSRLQSERKFFVAGSAQIIQGVVRLSLGILCVLKMPNILGAMYGVLLGNIAFVIANTFLYRKSLVVPVEKSFIPKRLSYKSLFISLGSVGLFSLLIYSDTILVRIFLPQESGLFASSNLLGKGMIFLTAGVSFVILPIMSAKINNIKKSLWIGFFCLLVLVLGYSVFFVITGPFLGPFLFKNDLYISQMFPRFMPFYNLMFLPYPLIYYFLNYYLVKESLFYPLVLCISVFLFYGGVIVFHSSIIVVSVILGGIGYILLCVVMVQTFFSQDMNNLSLPQITE